ncbi:MAG: hypothetical protein MJZ93_05075 [Paludibacteraceae bacterium]|nr:hypothetical protein [Paludibacteraceae bacterium]
MISNKSKMNHEADYTECLREIGAAIEQFRKESGSSIKPTMAALHMSHRTLRGVCPVHN